MKITQKAANAILGIDDDPPLDSGSHWEYIIHDFLETECLMSQEKRAFLLHELHVGNMFIREIEVHPTFSVNRRLISIVEKPAIEECWLYYPEIKRIEKHILKKNKF